MLSYLRRLKEQVSSTAQSVKERFTRVFVAATAFLAPVAVIAQEAGSGDQITAGIADLQATILSYVALGIGACIAILLVSLAGDIGIGVAKKWLRKGAS